jgi:hypothetical protein
MLAELLTFLNGVRRERIDSDWKPSVPVANRSTRSTRAANWPGFSGRKEWGAGCLSQTLELDALRSGSFHVTRMALAPVSQPWWIERQQGLTQLALVLRTE